MKAEIPAITSAATGDGDFFSWYRELNGKEKRTFWSCKMGYGLDAMDTQFLSFVIPTLIATWAISKADAATSSASGAEIMSATNPNRSVLATSNPCSNSRSTCSSGSPAARRLEVRFQQA